MYIEEDFDSNAYVRLLNAAEGADLDIRVNGRNLVSELGYKEYTGYTPAKEGTYHLRVYKNGVEILDRKAEFTKNTVYTVAIMGGKGACSLELVFDDSNPVREDKAFVRFINASPNGECFNILINSKKILLDLEQGEAGGYLELEPGEYVMEAADTITGKIKYRNPNVRLNAGRRYAGYIWPS